jgi:hypothetical protein
MAKKPAKKNRTLGKRDLKRTRGGLGTSATPVTSQGIVPSTDMNKIPGNLKWQPITGITSPTSTTAAPPP